MSARSVKEYEIQLLRMQDRLRSEVQDRVDTVPEKMKAQGDVTDLPTHNADHDVEGLETEVATGDAQNAILDQVDAALERIEEGTYGTCTACGQPIAEARLEAIPYADLCIECERKREEE